jgi:hypothetical protein
MKKDQVLNILDLKIKNYIENLEIIKEEILDYQNKYDIHYEVYAELFDLFEEVLHSESEHFCKMCFTDKELLYGIDPVLFSADKDTSLHYMCKDCYDRVLHSFKI